MFKRKVEYMAKLYVLADSQERLSDVANDAHTLIHRNGARFTGGVSDHDSSDGRSNTSVRFTTSSPEAARRIFGAWVEAASAQENVVVTGKAFGSTATGWEVWDVNDADEEHASARIAAHRQLYGR